jgi:predicted Zn-dependent peptidase
VSENIGEKLYMETTDSGLPVYILKRENIKTFYTSMLVNFGGMDLNYIDMNTKKGTKIPPGTAHFLEHKLFESEDKNILYRFAKQNASINAYTNNTSTVYYFSCTDFIEENMLLFLKLLQNPKINQESVDKEKGIIIQEVRMYNDNPGWRVYNNFLQNLYIRNNIRYSVTGSEKDVQIIDKDIILKCYNDFYTSTNMSLFIIGDVEPLKIFNIVNKCWERKQNNKIIRVDPSEPDYVEKNLIIDKMEMGESSFIMGFKEKHTGLEGRKLLKTEILFNMLLEYTMGTICPFFQQLYDNNYIDNTFGYGVNIHKKFMYIVINGNSNEPEIVRDAIFNEIEKVREKGISDEPFNMIKKMMTGSFIKILDSESALINNLIFYRNKKCDFFDIFDLINLIKEEDLMDIINKSFHSEGFVMSIVTSENIN